jgi:hypothetical protein
MDNFINEYIYFLHGKHDDMLDSVELAIEIATRPRVRPRIDFVRI